MSGYLFGEEWAGVYGLLRLVWLIVAGGGILVGCAIANWWQDRRFR